MHKPFVYVIAGALAAVAAAQEISISTISVDAPDPTEVFALPVVYLTEEGQQAVTATTLAPDETASSDPRATALLNSEAIASAAAGTTLMSVARAKRAVATCVPQPTGISHRSDPDTPIGFVEDTYYSNTALSASVPEGWVPSFVNLNASSSAGGYKGYALLDKYDVQTCSDKCRSITGCNSFNIYFERDPSTSPDDLACANPSSVINVKCVFWGGPVVRKNANNYGQWRNKFQVLVAGSNGYVKQTAVTLPKPDFKAKPAMGYNTYNPAACTINQTWIRETIDVFASKGFGAAGYSVFGLDCGWQGTQRQANGSIDYDASVFPDGISPLSQHANSKGFHWGMYTDQGVFACDTGVSRVGSLNHEKEDALQLAGWNVAYMKVDNCWITANSNAPKTPRTDFPSRFGAFSDAIRSVGIDGMLVCQWGTPYQSPSGLQGPAKWTPSLATSFRVSDDIARGWKNVMRIYNQAIHVNRNGQNGPGHWSDMDLLEVGEAGMTLDEQATHFAIWAMFKSPLFISTNIQTMSSEVQAILQNKGLIAINQDSLGKPVVLTQRFTNDNDQFAGPLANGDLAVLLVDQADTTRNLGIEFSALNISSATVTNLWTGEVVPNASKYFNTVNAHGSVALRLSDIVSATSPTASLVYYEAEAGVVSGARAASCSGCSGGKSVGYIGNGNILTINGIRTSQSTSDVRFDYVNCELGYLYDGGYGNVRGASISVNGGPAQAVTFPLSGYNWDVDVTTGFLVRLSGFNTAEANTITISGLPVVSPYAPDLDRIGIVA